MCVNYYSYLTTNQADSQPGWAKNCLLYTSDAADE